MEEILGEVDSLMKSVDEEQKKRKKVKDGKEETQSHASQVVMAAGEAGKSMEDELLECQMHVESDDDNNGNTQFVTYQD